MINMMIYKMLRKVFNTTSAKIMRLVFKSVYEYERGWSNTHEKQEQ
jgi:hypothetical protein